MSIETDQLGEVKNHQLQPTLPWRYLVCPQPRTTTTVHVIDGGPASIT